MASAIELAKLFKSWNQRNEEEFKRHTKCRKRSREQLVMEFEKDLDVAEGFVVSAAGVTSIKKTG